MTERLYYTDSLLFDFEAEVTESLAHDGRPAVVLEATAFYPTSGGQPADVGTIGEAHVVDVLDTDEGRIIHVLDRPLTAGSRLPAAVERARRFDHMQQHTGQHIFSAACDKLHRARTVGFHLGADVSTVDLAIPLAPEAIAAAEAEANRVVWEDRPVAIRFATAEEAAAMPLRKEPEREGTLRVIDVEGYDLSACGGTHVSRTGAVGLIAVLATERLRGGTRVEFVCGGRALRALRTFRDAVAGCIHSVSVAPAELPAAIERLQADTKDLRKAMKGLQDRLAGYEAEALAGRAEPRGDVRRLIEAVEGQDQNGLRSLALAVCAKPGYEVVLFSTSSPGVVVVARSKDGSLDCAAVLKGLMATFGGKGGGRGDLAQAGGLSGSPAEWVAAARAAF